LSRRPVDRKHDPWALSDDKRYCYIVRVYITHTLSLSVFPSTTRRHTYHIYLMNVILDKHDATRSLLINIILLDQYLFTVYQQPSHAHYSIQTSVTFLNNQSFMNDIRWKHIIYVYWHDCSKNVFFFFFFFVFSIVWNFIYEHFYFRLYVYNIWAKLEIGSCERNCSPGQCEMKRVYYEKKKSRSYSRILNLISTLYVCYSKFNVNM